MKIDFKVTAWERVTIDLPKELEDEVLQLIKEGEIETSNDLVTHLDSIGYVVDYETIPESEVQMTVEENDGDHTLEVIDDEGNTVYTNAE